MKDENGNDMWDGYCVDFVKKLSEEMEFDYDLVVPQDHQFGKKLSNGQWDGLIGDLAKGVRSMQKGCQTLLKYLYTKLDGACNSATI